MRIAVELVGRSAYEAGLSRLELQLPRGATARHAAEALVARFPQLGWILQIARPAVNLEYAAWDTVLSPGAEVAFIPPVSGGATGMVNGLCPMNRSTIINY
jgi:molybdopterin synthase catalytic subunit